MCRAVHLYLSGHLLIIETKDKFGGMEFIRSEILSLHNVETVVKGNSKSSTMTDTTFDTFKEMLIDEMIVEDGILGRNFAKRSIHIENQLIITYSTSTQISRTLKLYSIKAKQMILALKYVIYFYFFYHHNLY